MKRTISLILIFAMSVGLMVSLSACGDGAPSDEVLSALVADAVLSDNANVYHDGECSGEGHKILGSSVSGSKLKVYALTMYGNYGFQNDMFIKVSGSGVIPAVLTFEKNGDEYKLLEIEYPRDGSDYVKSIKRLFPLKYRAAALNTGNAYDELKIQEQRYAEVYLENIGREAEIGEYSDLNTILLTDLGVSVDVSNQLCCDKDLGDYPIWIGTTEYLEGGKRYVRSLSYDDKENLIIYKTYEKESGGTIEEFVFDAATGEPAETSDTELITAPAGESPQPGYYEGTGVTARYADGTSVQLPGMNLWLYEDGRACLDSMWTSWSEAGILNEFDTLGEFEYAGGHLSFGWESGDGYYTHEFDYQGEEIPEEPVSGFFDVVDEEPFFIYSEIGRHYGYTDDYWGGCSVWCAVSNYEITAEASSTLAPQGQYSYEAANVISGDRNNVWVEGADGYGIDEFIEITRSCEVGDAEYGVAFKELCIVNGYARTPETWAANSRVKELKFSFNGEYVDSLRLEDIIEPQYFDLTPYGLHADSGAESVWRFAIVSVYPGDKYEDTAITGIEVRFWTPNH